MLKLWTYLTKKADEIIIQHVNKNKPLLGICLGMQLLMTVGYESGERNGLGLISGEAVSFEDLNKDIRIPHVGGTL